MMIQKQFWELVLYKMCSPFVQYYHNKISSCSSQTHYPTRTKMLYLKANCYEYWMTFKKIKVINIRVESCFVTFPKGQSKIVACKNERKKFLFSSCSFVAAFVASVYYYIMWTVKKNQG